MRITAAALIFLLMLPEPALCVQSPVYSRDWSRLQRIPVGQELLVEVQGGKKIKGKFRAATDTSLELAVRGGASSFRAEEVLRVYWPVGRRVGSSTLIGAGGGAVVGYIIGKEAWNDGSDAVRGARTTGICIGVGVVAGAILGFIIGARNRRELIYESPRVDDKVSALQRFEESYLGSLAYT